MQPELKNQINKNSIGIQYPSNSKPIWNHSEFESLVERTWWDHWVESLGEIT